MKVKAIVELIGSKLNSLFNCYELIKDVAEAILAWTPFPEIQYLDGALGLGFIAIIVVCVVVVSPLRNRWYSRRSKRTADG